MRRAGRALVTFAGLTVATALVLVAGFVALNWAPDRPVVELEARWAPPPSTFIDLAGMHVHLRDEGSRDDPVPIVLLHGTSASLHTWDGWVAALAAERRVIRFDLPGFGLTGPTPDGDYRIERYVEFVAAMLDVLGIERCVLAGNSFGGNVAWQATLALPPGRVQQLVLVDAAGYPLVSESVPIAFRIARIPGLSSLMAVTLPRRLVESSVRNVYGDPDRITPELVDRYYEISLREGNRAALVERFAQAPHGQHADRIGAIQVPTLIIWGGRDRLIPPQ
ncbi:MAG: hypothetical protein QG586_1555, partial [Pseudomonadota bacterium]|nr:hypothetical protein [Pseudomonadota bacterium]